MELLFVLYGCLALAMLVQGQNQSGFISIDCGIAEGSHYKDEKTLIEYTSDVQYVSTGTNHNVSSVFMTDILTTQLSSLRSFPEGINNCYTINPAQAKGNNYLIRAIFMYGNYDSRNQTPEFELYLEATHWATLKWSNASETLTKEIIHIPATDYIHVCLVNTGSGTPFISALELRQLDNSIYKPQSGSLQLHRRIDVGSTKTNNQKIRYPDDIYDRIWKPNRWPYWQQFNASDNCPSSSSNDYNPPLAVIMTAITPFNGSSLEFNGSSLEFDDQPAYSSQMFYLYMHFAEIEKIQPNQLRKFNIYLNGDLWYNNSIVPSQQSSHTYKMNTYPLTGVARLNFSISATMDSTLPPILNALEIYFVKNFSQSPTTQNDVDAIRNIKSEYGVQRNWQGDPCVPHNYSWDNLECSYDNNSPKIISLNLSSSSLSGNIVISFSCLKSLQYLDLSNNSLTGQVPDILSQLPLLKTLNLTGNNLTGSVPSVLIERSKNGSLTLRTEGNPHLCQEASCARNNRFIIPLIASISSCLALLTAILAIFWSLKRKKQQVLGHAVKPNVGYEMMDGKNRHFTYSEVIRITNNFQKVLGQGGVGTVYAGQLNDGTQLAVKMLSQPSTQGSKQFQTETQLLTKVHHRNLVSIVGYCNEGQHVGLLYEYMANGNVKERLSEKNENILSWEQRLRIAFDTAQALEYLHNGCKPPVIHRDIKTANILLTENLQAKVSDFGISRLLPHDGGSHVSTTFAGTPGYLDPEYQLSFWLNEKSDVYSFGIVLLELITGKPAILKSHENTHIVQWVMPMLERGEIKEIADSRLNGDFDINSVWKAVETAMACVSPNSIQRPFMNQVVAELRECLDMEMDGGRAWKPNEEQNSAPNNSVYVDEISLSGPLPR